MTTDLDSLIKKLQSHRAKSPYRKVNYPARLKKAAVSLIANHSLRELADKLDVSTSSIRAWAKLSAPTVCESDFVAIGPEKPAIASVQYVKVRVSVVELSIPSGQLSTAVGDIIQGMGGLSC